MRNFGVAVDSLSVSQQNYVMCDSLNKMAEESGISPVMFVQCMGKPMIPANFPIMASSHLFAFDGPVVATSAQTCRVALNTFKTNPIYLYVWDLEWTQNATMVGDVYMNDKVNLIARSQQHFAYLEGLWKKPVATIEDFDHVALLRLTS